MSVFTQSEKLRHVCYEIRGPAMQQAKRLEEEGFKILKLNIGNPGVFGFDAPEEILRDVILNLPESQAYSDSKGLFNARKAVMHETQRLGIKGVNIDDIYLGNGVSELIVMSMQALCNNGDEVLVPAPDYPLWTAAITLSGGKAVHYVCDEEADWFPDIDDIKSKITPRTKAIVVINPNNPTGAVYSPAVLRELAELAREHSLLLLADEIYDRVLYDGAQHTTLASLAPDLLTLTFSGLSKTYRVAGFRAGWMVISGPRHHAAGFLEGIELLASTRLCPNVPAQHAIQVAVSGRQSIEDLVLPGGRLLEQRDVAWSMLNAMEGVSCVKPRGALYVFPRLDPEVHEIRDDVQLCLDLLEREKILVVHGSGFNWPEPDHLRIVTLPWARELRTALERLGNFLATYRQ